MGKFDGVLFYSDYDDTLYNMHLTVSPGNQAAVRYFMAEGGRFSIATGRAHRTFTPQIQAEGLAFNAPVVLSNGAAIYDYQADAYLVRTRLADETAERMAQVCAAFPDLAFEAYHGEDIYIHNPNQVTMAHLGRVGVPYTVCPIAEMPKPWLKVIMEQDEPYLRRVQAYIQAHWPEEYEAIFSNRYLLELTSRGSNKGTMVARMARELENMGLRVIPSRVNYLLFQAPRTLGAQLLSRGIQIRDCSNYPGLEQGWYRTAVKLPQQNQQLLDAIKEVVNG